MSAVSSTCRACSRSPSGTPRGGGSLARDRLGIKPLYYTLTDRELLSHRRSKAILAASPMRPSWTRGPSGAPRTRYVPGDGTFFRGIRKLQPGHTLTWSLPEGARRAATGNLPVPWMRARPGCGTRGGPGGPAGGCRRSHLMSDVPLGLFLPGVSIRQGLPPSCAHGGERLRTFAVASTRSNQRAALRPAGGRGGRRTAPTRSSIPEDFLACPKTPPRCTRRAAGLPPAWRSTLSRSSPDLTSRSC